MSKIENCIGSGVKITQVEFNIGLNGHMYTENGVAILLRQAGFKLYDDAYFVDKGKYLGNDEPTFVGLTSIKCVFTLPFLSFTLIKKSGKYLRTFLVAVS